MKKKKQKGYTLVEILVVVVIIGALAYLSVPMYNKLLNKSDVSDALHNMDMFSGAQSKYFIANGSYTSDLSELDSPLSGNTSEIATANYTYFAGDISEGNYCIYAKSNSRNYTLARNYRDNSEVLCHGRDCAQIDSFVKEGSLTDLCNGVYEGGECDLKCSSPKILDNENCKCVCQNQTCGEHKILNDSCNCVCDPSENAAHSSPYWERLGDCSWQCNKPETCLGDWDPENCICNEEPSSCNSTTCGAGYTPDPNDNCTCKCSLTADSCYANEELYDDSEAKSCSCRCKQSIVNTCDELHELDGLCNCKCKSVTKSCPDGQLFNEETCQCASTCERTEDFCKTNYSANYVLGDNCECVCGISADHCNPGETFEPAKCLCIQCEWNLEKCQEAPHNSNYIFSQENCTCECGLKDSDCPSGYHADNSSCECKLTSTCESSQINPYSCSKLNNQAFDPSTCSCVPSSCSCTTSSCSEEENYCTTAWQHHTLGGFYNLTTCQCDAYANYYD